MPGDGVAKVLFTAVNTGKFMLAAGASVADRRCATSVPGWLERKARTGLTCTDARTAAWPLKAVAPVRIRSGVQR